MHSSRLFGRVVYRDLDLQIFLRRRDRLSSLEFRKYLTIYLELEGFLIMQKKVGVITKITISYDHAKIQNFRSEDPFWIF